MVMFPALVPLIAALTLVLELVAPMPSLASSFTGQVVGVIDGDTIEVLHNGQAERIRLNGIDCPEKHQAFGKKAKQFTSELVYGKEVTVQAHRLDKYGRTIGDVLLEDGTNLNRELVKAGLAWRYLKYSKDESLSVLEGEAREAKRGLWVDAEPIPPWEYRHPTNQLLPAQSLLAAPLPSADSPTIIIGNNKSRVYHRPDCPNYTATAAKNRRMFMNVDEAEAAGYRVAGNCPIPQ
jgi:micrococcal nuclease